MYKGILTSRVFFEGKSEKFCDLSVLDSQCEPLWQ